MIFHFLHGYIMKSTPMCIRSVYCPFLKRSLCDKSFLISADRRKIEENIYTVCTGRINWDLNKDEKGT